MFIGNLMLKNNEPMGTHCSVDNIYLGSKLHGLLHVYAYSMRYGIKRQAC